VAKKTARAFRATKSPQRARPAEAPDAGAVAATAALVLAIAGAGLAVDPRAAASFDAPKRLVALAAAAVASLAAFGFSRWKNPFLVAGRISSRTAAAFLFLAACAGALLAALSSPRRALALDGVRTVLLFALFLPLGASRVFERDRNRRLVLSAFLAVVAANAALSLLQALELSRVFRVLTQGSRDATGAFQGNTGYLALALALAAVASLVIALLSRTTVLRAAAGIGAAAFAGALLVNRNLTSFSALLAGAALFFFARFGRRAAIPVAALLLLVAAGIAAYRPMRQRAGETIAALRGGDWDRLVSYRVGPWSAAVAMALERPWTGWGPGTFGAEFVPHRLRMEIALHRRTPNPELTSSYAEAHCDYLQPFAEAGIPAGLAALLSVVFLFGGLLAAMRRLPPGPARAEALFLLAFLGAGAVAALTWFPLQRPISAVPLLLAAGRAWRISDGPAGGTP
jgi:O-antigen ligase